MPKKIKQDNSEHHALTFGGFMSTFVEIICTKCGAEDHIFDCDELSAPQEFYDLGWRVTSRNCYCPSCAEKHKVKGL